MAAAFMERPSEIRDRRTPTLAGESTPGVGVPVLEEAHVPLRVLLVDDTPDDEALALRAMRLSGIPLLVRVARDGEQALRALGVTADTPIWTPDLIVCDLKMPKLRGDEVLERVRRVHRLAETPFVIFSSSDDSGDADRCLRLGADAYVIKPVDFTYYVQTVKGAVLSHLSPIVGQAKRQSARPV
jgi:CheY-like chemotaxis protein